MAPVLGQRLAQLARVRGVRPTKAAYAAMIFVVIMAQVIYMLKGSSVVIAEEPYYQGHDGFKIVKAKPPADSSKPLPKTTASNTHLIMDYPDEGYYHNNEFGDYDNLDDINRQLSRGSQFKTFINQLMVLVHDASPELPNLNNDQHYNRKTKYGHNNGRMPTLLGKLRENNAVDPIRSKNYLSDFFHLNDEELNKLSNSHQKFVDSLPDKFPTEVELEFKGRGILYAGGGSYNWLVLLSLKMLRDSGSKLPVEVFIPTNSEYSSDLCERVFPIFGAKCIVMENYIDVKKYEFKGYQLKSMALLLTSFEDVLLLDSDNIPLKNPDMMFINEPYTSNGMIIWPDFWRRSTSPLFYDITKIPVDEMNQVRLSYGDERDHPEPLLTKEDYNENISYHDLLGTFPEASAETGQILINKKTHAKAIFLSLYYNFYGPGHYYPLLSQGQAGEGDKETLLAAAHKMGLPYYQVQEFIREYGEETTKHDFHINAMGQYDPILDHLQSQDPVKYKSDQWKYDSTKNNYLMHRYNQSETMFLHCNQPKLYPWRIHGNGFRQVFSGTKRRRLYSHYLFEELGYDAEAKIWHAMEWLVCEHGDIQIKDLDDPKKWCQAIREQIVFLNEDYPGYNKSKDEAEHPWLVTFAKPADTDDTKEP